MFTPSLSFGWQKWCRTFLLFTFLLSWRQLTTMDNTCRHREDRQLVDQTHRHRKILNLVARASTSCREVKCGGAWRPDVRGPANAGRSPDTLYYCFVAATRQGKKGINSHRYLKPSWDNLLFQHWYTAWCCIFDIFLLVRGRP